VLFEDVAARSCLVDEGVGDVLGLDGGAAHGAEAREAVERLVQARRADLEGDVEEPLFVERGDDGKSVKAV
jgi:hypothetical protein